MKHDNANPPYWARRPEKTTLTACPRITEKEISYVTDAVTNGWTWPALGRLHYEVREDLR